MVKIPKGVWTQPLEIKQSYQLVHEEKEELTTLAIEKGVPWSYDIMKFLELRIYLDSADKKGCHLVRMMVMQYILCEGQLYRRFYDGIHLHCLK